MTDFKKTADEYGKQQYDFPENQACGADDYLAGVNAALEAAAKIVNDSRGESFDLRSVRDEIRALKVSSP